MQNYYFRTILIVLILHTTYSKKGSINEIKWKLFIHTHNKTYSNTTEETYRQEVFLENMRRIDSHNRLYMRGVETYKLRVNQYADITGHEFNSLLLHAGRMNSVIIKNKNRMLRFIPNNNLSETGIPESLDWRQRNAVTPVKDQGTCGSCWAFSAAASLESAHFIRTGRRVTLSEQNLLDCTPASPEAANTCRGGSVEAAVAYAARHGLATAHRYPYTGEKHPCRYNATDNVLPQVYGYVPLPSGDEDGLRMALALNGPISVCIDATYVQFYSEGVFSDKRCKSQVDSLTHALLAVGYGTDDGGLEYWLLKNSWGRSWGEEGYMRLARNKGNMCGVATEAIYPVM